MGENTRSSRNKSHSNAIQGPSSSPNEASSTRSKDSGESFVQGITRTGKALGRVFTGKRRAETEGENTTKKKKKKNANSDAIPVDSRDAQANDDSSGEDTATQSTNISMDIDPETHSISQGTDVISNYTYPTERDGENLRNYSNDELVANIINGLQDVSTYIGYMKTVQPDLLYNGRIASLVNSIAEDTILSKLHTLTNAVTNLTSTVRDIQDTVNLTLCTRLDDIENTTHENQQRILKRLEGLEQSVKAQSNAGISKASNSKEDNGSKTKTPSSTTPTQPVIPKPADPKATQKLHIDPTEAYHPSRAVFIFEGGIPEAERLPPDEICQRLNEGLAKIPKARHFKIVAAKYTQHGNLLANTKATQNASELIEHAAQLLPLLHSKHKASARPDVKWWKIQIDGVATRRLTVAGDVEPYTGEAVHNELKTCNQLYADIIKHIVATPRWLRTAEELRRTLHSSLVFAIDNEDAAKALLKGGKLAAFGRYCTLRPFQDRPPVIQCTKCWGWDHRRVVARSNQDVASATRLMRKRSTSSRTAKGAPKLPMKTLT
ncbi:hypothetical protein BKA70DRAFT_293114 [Coprinopsis sp. MPI-PUGE-AT-0042]|nr:hypothetical protein BKA70DRAFT_293114 [Coprinopsis sp. MPI-PUGE-AT-0042]